MKTLFFLLSPVLFLTATTAGATQVEFSHRYPCNLFETGTDVDITVSIRNVAPEVDKIEAMVTNYWDEVVFTEVIERPAEKLFKWPLSMKGMNRGYFTLYIRCLDANGTSLLTKDTTFGVADFFNYTAEEVKEKGLRFGMRQRNDDFEGIDGSVLLGMNWGRNLFVSPGSVARSPNVDEWEWDAALERFRQNVTDRNVVFINKVEMFPKHAYDSERYGPIEEYRDPVGKHPWSKRTLPLEEPYKEWVRESTRRKPPEEKIFQIWNEPWGKYPPEDFAKISIWATEAIKEVRPDAIVGPNSGNIGYDIELAKHGALDVADQISIHPYIPHPEEYGIRTRIRTYREFMREHIGRELPLYTSEWGFTTAFGKRLQAAYMVRQALAMYAEDIQSLIPYILTPNRKEHLAGATAYGYVSFDYKPYAAFIGLCQLRSLN